MSPRHLPILIAACLAGCDSVSADLPLFTTADEAGADSLRQGVWMTEVAGCAVKANKPLKHWPKCADGWLYERGERLRYASSEASRPLIDQPIVVAAGSPRIIQYSPHIGINGVLASGDAAMGYRFAAFLVTQLDPEGRVTAFESWDILCADDGGVVVADNGSAAPASARHLQGVDEDCQRPSAAGLRKAATASEAQATSFRTSHWVRDQD